MNSLLIGSNLMYLRSSLLANKIRLSQFNSSSISRLEKGEHIKTGSLAFVLDDSSPNKNSLIILLGFGGSNDKVISKYSAFYDGQGYSQIRYIPTVDVSKIVQVPSYRLPAKLFYEQLQEKCPDLAQRKIVFHMFSLNGCNLFLSLWNSLDNQLDDAKPKIQRQQIKGLIFDSCPADLSSIQNAVAFARIFYPPDKHPIMHYSYMAFTMLRFSIQSFAIWLNSRLFSGPNLYSRLFCFHAISKMAGLPQQQLYLYAENDPICSAKSTRTFIDLQRTKGAKVIEKCWPDSGHCRHGVVHPQEYKKLCNDFVHNCFK